MAYDLGNCTGHEKAINMRRFLTACTSMRSTMKKAILTILAFAFLHIGCSQDPLSQYTYLSPEQTEDGLVVGSLIDVNIDSSLVIKAVDRIRRGRYGEVHSMLIFKDHKLVLEEYFTGHRFLWEGHRHRGELINWNRDTPHRIMSDTKSITSACIGIAIDQGFIKSVHQSIFDYLPEHRHLRTAEKDEITIEHLLTMTSGLEGKEWGAPYSSLKNPIINLWFCEDPLTCILEKPLLHSPGTHFSYFGGGNILLGEIIKHATGTNIDEFSRKYLFMPLVIDSTDWALRFENGVIEAAGGLKITSRAMVKVGALYLNKGLWQGKRIISGTWVEKSATAFNNNLGIDVPGEDSGKNGYAYSWWTRELSHKDKKIKTFYAGGWGGQKIIVIPDLNAVVVFTGGNYLAKTREFSMIEKYIIPSMVGT